MGLVQNWRKNKRKILSYTTDGLKMYSSKPIPPKPVVVPTAPTPTPLKFVSQSGSILSVVRPMVSTSNSQGTVNLPGYNQQFRGVIRQTRPIQISVNGKAFYLLFGFLLNISGFSSDDFETAFNVPTNTSDSETYRRRLQRLRCVRLVWNSVMKMKTRRK